MKLVPVSLDNEIKANVTTLATCIEIRRTDGKTFRITNHDASLTVDGSVFTHQVPFNLSSINAGSSMTSDDTELTVFIDGALFLKDEMDGGVFAGAEVTIMLVNFLNTSQGRIVLREGWFGPVDTQTYGVAKITIYGLLKVLDIEIGRIYQPSCDADLGDKRCKIAIKANQFYSDLETYRTGDWVYYFDPAEATALTVVNGGFETGAPIAGTSPIPGWTKSADNSMAVTNDAAPSPYEGGYKLAGGETEAGRATERFLYQDIDLVAEGVNAAEIDNGRISYAVFGNLAQNSYLLDLIRLRVEILDTNKNIIDYHDDGYAKFANFNVWYERALSGPLLAGARYIRIYIYTLITDGINFNTNADNIRAYWWDHTLGTPYSDVIHKVSRIVRFDASTQRNAENGSFEANSVSNSNVTAITGWTRGSSADWWKVVQNSYLGINPPNGSHTLIGGDDSSATQKTYQISQTKNLVDLGLNTDDIDTGRIIGKLLFNTIYYDTVSSARVEVSFLDEIDTLLLPLVPVDYAPKAAPVIDINEVSFAIPTLARKVVIRLYARSGVGVSNADVGFDNFRWYLIDAVQARKDDPISGDGLGVVAFDMTPGSYTIDGPLIWKAHTAHVMYDEVAAVTDRKLFTGTAISGGTTEYVTAVIRWISGANKGQKNLIRLWDSTTKEIKLYFPTTAPIEVGDRFQYTRPCAKRFLEDCVLTFDNVINFRGFPHLPGKLSDS